MEIVEGDKLIVEKSGNRYLGQVIKVNIIRISHVDSIFPSYMQ